jgi:hypothetical protein
MEQKEKYIKHVYDLLRGSYLFGPLSSLKPSTRELSLVYSDGSTDPCIIEEANVNITENPMTGKVDITIKLTLEKQELQKETGGGFAL